MCPCGDASLNQGLTIHSKDMHLDMPTHPFTASSSGSYKLQDVQGEF